MDPDEPLIDLASAPASPSEETPLLPLEAAVNSLSNSEISLTTQASGASGGNNLPTQQPQADTANAARRFVLTPWYFTRVCAVYIGPVQYVPGEISNGWLIASEAVFFLMALGQVVLTATFITLGVISKDKVDGARNELSACPELVVTSLLWLVRPIYVGYLLLWAYMFKRMVVRLRKARHAATAVSRPPNVGESLADGAQAEHMDAEAGCGLSDEDMRKLLPTPQSISIHLRLVTFTPLVTFVLNVALLSTWYARLDHCRSRSPHISLLAGIIALTANFSLAVHSVLMFISSLKTIVRSIRSRLPSVAPLSQAAVDRIPVVIYRTAVSLGRLPPKDRTRSDFIQAFSVSSLPSRLSDVENDMEATPLLGSADFLDAEDDIEATPLVDLADSPSVATQDSPYPYISLPDEEAKCTICLCDFTDSSGLAVSPEPDVELIDLEESHQSDVETGHRAVHNTTSESPPLLRRLSCGHVYHKECIDPWLTQKSGRCPYCQKAVEVPGKLRWSLWKFLKCG